MFEVRPLAGHSGLEAATWLGDLGGGGAMLSDTRVSAPKTRARTRFVGTDFGGSINLEGDVASYVVALDPATTDEPSEPVFSNSTSPIADALASYLQPGTNGGTQWDSRAQNFLLLMGGEFTGGVLTNRAELLDDMTDKIEAFGCYYLVNRLRQTGRLTSAHLRKAATFLPGAAREVADIFIDTLERNMVSPNTPVRALADPPPSGPAAISFRCQAAIRSVEAMENTRKITDDLRRRLGF